MRGGRGLVGREAEAARDARQGQGQVAVGRCEHCHIGVEGGGVAAAVVEGEEEAAREGRGGRVREERRVHGGDQGGHVRVAFVVQARQGGRDEVAYPLVRGGREQVRLGEAGRQFPARVGGEGAELDVAA